jgi:hypothetical protein
MSDSGIAQLAGRFIALPTYHLIGDDRNLLPSKPTIEGKTA